MFSFLKLKGLSVSAKIRKIILLISGLGLLIATSIYTIVVSNESYDSLAKRVSALGEAIATNTTAAISFEDKATAEKILNGLQVEPAVITAQIYLSNGDFFAHYLSSKHSETNEQSIWLKQTLNNTQRQQNFGKQYFEFFSPIQLDSETIGYLYIKSSLSAVHNKIVSLNLFSGSIFLILLIFGYWLSTQLQKSISNPINSLAQGMRSVSTQQDYTLRVEKLDDDEIGELIAGFNHMLEQLEVRDKELRAYREELELKVEERTAELVKSKEAAEAGSRAKSEFLANMSHEIRTPLNAVLGLADIGIEENTDHKSSETFQHIHDSGEHLLGVINDILDFSKMEAGKLDIESQSFNLSHEVNKTFELIREQAEQKGVELSLKIDPNVPSWVSGDLLRIRQILLNLLSNAVKFTRQGLVSLSVYEKNNNMQFRIADTGIGISEAQIASLFTPFQQADSSTTRQFGGTGLGLAISNNLAKLMGGEITVSSELGQGSIFSVSLPLPKAHPNTEPKTTKFALKKSRLKGIRVLAVEDIEMNRMILQHNLEREEAEYAFAENGEDAVNVVKNQGADSFDIVLMDIQMPIMDGYEATHRIHEFASNVPIIGLTAHALEEERQRALRAGMVDHVTKPINPDALVKAILKHQKFNKNRPTPALTKSITNHYLPNELPEIDIKKGLEQVDGNHELFNSILLLFLKHHTHTSSELISLIQNNHFHDAAIMAHGLKGACANIGAIELLNKTITLEQACKEQDEKAAIAAMNQISNSLKIILEGISDLKQTLHYKK